MKPDSAAKNARYQIRTALAHDVPLIYELADREGWNPGEYDAEAAAQGMPGAFLLGELDGQVIASIAAAEYGDDWAYMSFYLVRPEYRRQGYGSPLWHIAMERLKGRNIVFDAMPKQVDFYEKLGFKIAHPITAYHFRADASDFNGEGLPLRPLQRPILEEVLVYDQAFFPTERSRYMREWLSMPNACGFVWKEKNLISGYGLIRKAKHGYRIGPCYADSPEIAYALLRMLLVQAQGMPVSISMPGNNPSTEHIVRDFDLIAGSQLQRMYSQAPLELPFERIIGITNCTFG